MVCPVAGCGRSIANKKRYSDHLSWHRGETVCQLCGRQFSSKTNLRIHQNNLHGLPMTPIRQRTAQGAAGADPGGSRQGEGAW